MTFPHFEAVSGQHTAFLGKTGSGKTSTAKLAIEQAVATGARVCILDPIKSDWWGVTSSADGKREGLPFRILGGPRGHVALPSSAGAVVGKLVATGALPLSIVDMADFEPGGLQRFFVDFAPALLRHMRGVLYLVIEEAHEFAPKERAGFSGENMTVHFAKKLATAGRSKGIRLIVATQRVQALHNAVLGSCETMIAHRLTAPADQKPVTDWLAANASRDIAKEIAASMAALPTGTGWLCSGEAQLFERIAFPKFQTFDNAATPTADSEEVAVKTAAVDHDELASLIGDAVAEAEANDPKKLKAEVARLTKELAAKEVHRKSDIPPAPAWPDQREEVSDLIGQLETARAESDHFKGGFEEYRRRIFAALSALGVETLAALDDKEWADGLKPAQAAPAPPPRRIAPAPAPVQRQPAPAREARSTEGFALSKAQRRILDAVAWWEAFGIAQPKREQVAFIAGYSPTSGGLFNLLGGLRSAGMLDYPAGGLVALTDAGRDAAEMPEIALTRDAFHAAARAKLSAPQVRVLDPALTAYPNEVSSDEVADAAGYSRTSGGFFNLRGSLRTLGLLDYPSPGTVRAADWLFP